MYATKSRRRIGSASNAALLAQIEFTEWMPDGYLRHSRFVELREDKRAKEVVGRTGDRGWLLTQKHYRVGVSQ
jgi:ATP-dependent DNA ligase